jgi:hypothetical protein
LALVSSQAVPLPAGPLLNANRLADLIWPGSVVVKFCSRGAAAMQTWASIRLTLLPQGRVSDLARNPLERGQ